ncbi:MAG: hypothetical protein JEZ04_12525 [Spirochaetales bacterium]|nr:hypothetical protein [Spirochaetales bacterium]
MDNLMRPYRRRHRLLTLWDGFLTGLLFSLAPALLTSVTGFTPWYSLLFVLSLGGGFLFISVRSRELYRRIERLTGLQGEISTLADYYKREEPNPYLPLLYERVRKRLSQYPAEGCFPANPGKRLVKTIFLSAVLWALLILPGLIGTGEADLNEVVRNSAVSLQEASEQDSRFTPLAEHLRELEKELLGEDEFPEAMKELEDLSKELTEQIRELERNSLTRLFEERGETRAEQMERLSMGDMSLPETRELIMDLLSDPSVDEETRKSIRQSFQDYSEAAEDESSSSREEQQKLAEELMSNLDPERMELVRELKDVLNDLESLTHAPEDAPENPESAGDDEISQADRESRRTGGGGADSLEPEPGSRGAPTTAAGSKPGKAGGEGSVFEPWEGDSPEVRLPEGEIRERRKQGVLRLEGSESLNLERISPQSPEGERVKEEEISIQAIPEEKRPLVRDYFTSIGSEPEN